MQLKQGKNTVSPFYIRTITELESVFLANCEFLNDLMSLQSKNPPIRT